MAALTLALLAWHANRHTPVKYIYDWLPALYSLRFPNRLLVVAAGPVIVLGGAGLQHLSILARSWGRGIALTLTAPGGKAGAAGLPLHWLLQGGLGVVLLLSLRDVYEINRGFGFAPRPMNAKAHAALAWLKAYDPSLYYTQIGGFIYWDWTPPAYDLELPVINFRYNRHVASQDRQMSRYVPGALPT